MNFSNFKKIGLKNKLITYALIFCIINGLLIYFFVFATIDRIKILRNDILNIKIELENKMTREKNLNDLNQKIKKIEPQLEKINQIFISQNREIEFITTLEGLEKEYNIDQKLNIDFNGMQKGESFSKVPISIDTSGSFSNLMNYLTGLESFPYYLNIENISFQKTGTANTAQTTDSKNAPISMKITGYTYWK